MSVHPRVLLPASVAVLAALTLAGCSTPIDNLVSGAVDRAVEEVVPEGFDVTTDGEIPEGFPAQVHLVDGTIIGGAAGGDAGWTVVVQPEGAALFADAESKLTAAGFTANVSDSDAASAFGSYSGNGYNVQLTFSTDPDGVVTAIYVVTPQ